MSHILLYIIGGILLILLALPIYLGKGKPNPWNGFLMLKMMDDPDTWSAFNKMRARWMLITGVLTLVITMLLAFVPNLSMDAYENTCALIFWGGVTVGGVLTYKYIIDRL